jgi:hypothetical protein
MAANVMRASEMRSNLRFTTSPRVTMTRIVLIVRPVCQSARRESESTSDQERGLVGLGGCYSNLVDELRSLT